MQDLLEPGRIMMSSLIPVPCKACIWRSGVEVHCSRYRVMQSVKRDVIAAKILCSDAIRICRWDYREINEGEVDNTGC